MSRAVPGRYADVMVHRLLAASLRLADLPEASKDRDSVRRLSDNLNTRHRNAQMAGRASVELHTLIYFKDRTVLADARITKVGARQQGEQRKHAADRAAALTFPLAVSLCNGYPSRNVP